MNPVCPRCRVAIPVERATFLMADNSRSIPYPKDFRRRGAGDRER
jgi:hypothetical protein